MKIHSFPIAETHNPQPTMNSEASTSYPVELRKLLTGWHGQHVSAYHCASRSRLAAAPGGTGPRCPPAPAGERTGRARSTAPLDG